ncbi:hypothetical protein [Pseudomonas sp. H2_D02]
MATDGSLAATASASVPVARGTARWLAPTLQSLALVVLLCGVTLGGWPLYLGLPLAMLIVWLPRLRSRLANVLGTSGKRQPGRADPRPLLYHQP